MCWVGAGETMVSKRMKLVLGMGRLGQHQGGVAQCETSSLLTPLHPSRQMKPLLRMKMPWVEVQGSSLECPLLFGVV